MFRGGVVGGDRGSVKCDRFPKFQLMDIPITQLNYNMVL